MGGEGEHVDVHSLHIDGQVPRRLNGVGVEQNPRLPADRADLCYRLHGADLVVGKHHGDQAGIRPDGLLHLLRRHHAVRRNIQQCYFIPLLLQG